MKNHTNTNIYLPIVFTKTCDWSNYFRSSKLIRKRNLKLCDKYAITRKIIFFMFDCSGEEISRSYTPVPGCLFSTYKPQNYTTDNVCLMVKSYPSGNISKYICSKNKDDTLELSKPLGTFNLRDLESREMFLMLAAGTGITPMLTLLLFLLERRSRKW